MNKLHFTGLAALLLGLILALTSALALADGAAVESVEASVTEIKKYGNLVLSISAKGFLEQGYEYGDVVKVEIAGKTLEMPVGSNYADVDNGGMICRVTEKQDAVALAINMGDLATTLGIAEKTDIGEDPGFRWDLAEGVGDPIVVVISMKEKGGYADEYMVRQLSRTNERADYPDLTDGQYANFRMVTTTGMGDNTLYRSSSPVNPKINRNVEADAALDEAGVATIMNLADSEETMKAYEGFADSHYSSRDVIALSLDMDYSADSFRAGLAEGIRFFASHEGPYLVHCTEGKDRSGFVCAVLECLMGASAEEVEADYMITFFNYYGVEPGTEQYEAVARSNIRKILAKAFGVESIADQDLAGCAEKYLREIGVSDGDIAALKANLATSSAQ